MTPIPDLTLVGLTGRAHTGKDSAADYLCSRYGFVRASFAEPIRQMLFAMFEHAGIDHAWLTEPHLKNQQIDTLGLSGRHLMQTLGTEWGREHLGDDIWVHLLSLHLGIHDGRPVHDRIVITDVRFPNEAAWLQAQGGRLVRLQREQAPAVRGHTSEAHIDALPADLEIHNHAPTLAGLEGLLDGTMSSWGLGERDPLEC